MIIVRLLGGLGNQMFEYAMAKSLAIKKNVDLKIDLTWVHHINQKKNIDVYGLKHFNIDEEFANEDDLKKYKSVEKLLTSHNRVIRKTSRIINHLLPYSYRKIYFERFSGGFAQGINQLGREVLLIDSYFMSYKYFEEHNDLIRQKFQFKSYVETNNSEYTDLIKNKSNTVSIHIRRGDYVSNLLHDVCNLNYYYRAVDKLLSYIKTPHFIIFSDDIGWAKQNLKLEYEMTFIDGYQEQFMKNIGHNNKGYNDLYLMSLCEHNIIANSTFSWWGAWLNSNRNKIIIAPGKWFNSNKLNTKYLLPDNWIKV